MRRDECRVTSGSKSIAQSFIAPTDAIELEMGWHRGGVWAIIHPRSNHGTRIDPRPSRI